MKPILCLDFDGVIHSYTSGWMGAHLIPDPPLPGAIAFLRRASLAFRIVIFSSRSNQPGGLEAMRAWLNLFAFKEDEDANEWLPQVEFATEKPPAFVTIDDRALTFNGDWNAYPVDYLLAFKPWNKK